MLKSMPANSESSMSTLDPKSTAKGLVMECHSFTIPSRMLCDFTFSNSPLSCRIFLTRRRKIAILYVSLKQLKNSTSHSTASTAAIPRTLRHPSVCAIAPLMAGPMLIALPRCSDANMSPMMGGLSTFEATARPVSMRAAMKVVVEVEKVARSVQRMNMVLQPCTTGARPRSSERGAARCQCISDGKFLRVYVPMRRGPAASPSSHMVTRRADVDEEPGETWPSRSSTIRLAIGTTPIQVKVLRSHQYEIHRRNGQRVFGM
jgi:hypothetical protein